MHGGGSAYWLHVVYRCSGLCRLHPPCLAAPHRPSPAAAKVEEEVIRVVCDADCVKGLEGTELVTLPSGLQYKDVVVGKGPTPPTGYQVGE